MADDPTNLVLEYLRAIRAKLDDMASDITGLKQRMGLLEGKIAHLSGNTRSFPTGWIASTIGGRGSSAVATSSKREPAG
jgi:hypothetical protein